ncbi:MAG: NifB/NifX family molybdenum-iron cluster-binding protein [Thermodesulfobacteriota bacterium]|jgi:predicted Fe-Mo cluster-binding NifX family protein|nr:NifB/NifX family molybdenum-iron cluster-binding protein [Thermodesulfobacteriota bacterium]
MSMNQTIAVPSKYPGGLNALRSGHFGRCDVFTLVEVHQGRVEEARVVANAEHSEGGCLVPVRILQQAGATSLVVQGIGMRPRIGFAQAGIEVLVGPGETVSQVVEAYLNNQLRSISEQDVCGAHG